MTRLTNYANPNHPQTKAALDVIDRLQEWFDSRESGGTIPTPSIDLSRYTLQVSVGDVCVWDGNEDHSSELTFDECLQRYRDYVTDLLIPFREESYK